MISESQKLDFPGLFSSSGFRTEKQQTSQTKNLKKHCIFNTFGKHKCKNAKKTISFCNILIISLANISLHEIRYIE